MLLTCPETTDYSATRAKAVRQSRRGFTLVELLVVIGIIAILISILFPAFSTVREQSRRVQCLSNLRSFGLLLNAYANDNNQYVPLGYAAQKHCGYMVYQNSAFQILGCLYESGYFDQVPQSYFCPSNLDTRWQYNSPDNPWPPPVAASSLCRLGMTVRPCVLFNGMMPQTSTYDSPLYHGNFPKLTMFTDQAIAAEMFGEPVNASEAVNPTLLSHPGFINVYYADQSAAGVNVKGVDPADGQSIETLLAQLAALQAVPTGQQMCTIYLNENVTPQQGIWHKFDNR